jgi:hypothetical protein
MSKRDLKKFVSELTKTQLEEQVIELYEKFKDVKVYYDFVFNPNKNEAYRVRDIYMKKIDISNNLYKINNELYLNTAIINYYSLMYDNVKDAYSASLDATKNGTQQLMYHIVTNEFITRDLFTKGGLQVKSYGDPQKLDPQT